MKLIIGNKNYSSWSLRPWFLLKHFGIKFEEIRIPLFTADYDSVITEFTDAHKVPVLQDAELTVWDSLAICEYISEQYLDGKGWPSKLSARAEARSASAEMHSGFFEIREHMPMNCRAQRHISLSKGVSQEILRIDTLWQSLRKKYQSQGKWLLGEFSIADCMYAPIASRFHTYQSELSETSRLYIQDIINHPEIKNWYQQATDEEEVIEQSEVGQDRS